MFTLVFWVATVERAIKTFAQTLLAVIALGPGAGQLGFNLLHFAWIPALEVAGGAAALSVLTSLASLPFGPGDSPSLVGDRRGRHELRH